jgi:cytochrome c oxidase subunit 2
MPRWISLTFQDRASIVIIELSRLHDYIIIVILSVIILISYILIILIVNKVSYKFLSEGTIIETIWSIVPAIVLIILVIPSVKVLYYIEDRRTPILTFKILGHQWYWCFFSPLLFNQKLSNKEREFNWLVELSYIEENRTLRLLETTNRLIIPVNVSTRLIVASADVIHSFSVPAIGLKVDAIPGRINQLQITRKLVGNFYGQCSEICGTNHSFIPILIKVRRIDRYLEINKNTGSELLLEV